MVFKVDNPNEFLKNTRIRNGIKLKTVSELTGLSIGYISRIESGSSKITKSTLDKLCKVYSLDISTIVEGDFNLEITESKNDISHYISNNKIFFNEKELFASDKIAIIDFIEFLVTVEDYTIKESCINIIKSAIKLSTAIKEEKE